MIDELKPYPKMKDSGVPWLGEVPAHWEVLRLRTAVDMRVSNVDKHSKEDEQPVRLCNYVDVYKHERIRDEMDFMRATATAEESQRFRLKENDVLITKDSEAWDDIGVPALVEYSAPDLISGYHLALLRPRQEITQGAYLFRALQSRPVSYQLHVEAKGVTRYGLSHQGIKSCCIPLPPLPEQTAIVRFLDYVGRRVRRVIRARQRLVDLLEEYKQTLIHQAVTGRIDVRTGQPYPEYKDSGVEWLGEVPAHWEVVPLKRVARFKSGAGFPVSEQGGKEGDIPFLRVSDMNRAGNEEWIEEFDSVVTLDTANRLGAFVFPAETIIFPKVGGALLTNKRRRLRRPSCIDNNVMGCIVDVGDMDFVFTLLKQIDLGRLAKPGPVPAISEGDVREIPVAMPPLPEQTAIVRFLDEQTASIDRAADAARREIDLLKEFRTRLIADVVTGKLDVREVAARLPEDDPLRASASPRDPEPLEEVEL